MDEQQIRQIIQEELDARENRNAFNVNLIPFHEHTGVDSAKINPSNLDITLDAGTTKTTPGTVNGWIKITLNAVVYYIPVYTSKTS